MESLKNCDKMLKKIDVEILETQKELNELEQLIHLPLTEEGRRAQIDELQNLKVCLVEKYSQSVDWKELFESLDKKADELFQKWQNLPSESLEFVVLFYRWCVNFDYAKVAKLMVEIENAEEEGWI